MIVGLIANPMASKDIRRLVELARVVDVEEKANLVARLLVGLATEPTIEVHALDDASGLVRRAHRLAGTAAPPLHWLPVEAERSELDTVRSAAELRKLAADVIVTIGGDGTVRAAVEAWPDACLVPIAAGTNNAIALTDEPTVIGVATAHAADPDVAKRAFRPRPRLVVETGEATATAVVDVVGVRDRWVASGALWEPGRLVEAVVTAAHPTAVGLASVSAGLGPIPPDHARYLRFGTGTTVRAVFGPGMIADLDVAEHAHIPLNGTIDLDPAVQVVALDGERRLVKGDRCRVTVGPGPRILDPEAALRR